MSELLKVLNNAVWRASLYGHKPPGQTVLDALTDNGYSIVKLPDKPGWIAPRNGGYSPHGDVPVDPKLPRGGGR